jgi:hypothetical protein
MGLGGTTCYSKKRDGAMEKRAIRIAVVLSILVMAGIAAYLLLPSQPEEVAPKVPTPMVKPTETPAVKPEETPIVKPEETPAARLEGTQIPAHELSFEGIIVRSSGDTNPFFGTPWISVGCFGYVGEPIITVDVEILDIFDSLREAGLEAGQNILYTGQEETPQGSSVKLFIEWTEAGKIMSLDISQIIFDKKTGEPLGAIGKSFVFLGSYYSGGELQSESTGCIACTVNCPRTLFAKNKADSGYYMERSRYYIPEGILPEVGTKVTVIIAWGE